MCRLLRTRMRFYLNATGPPATRQRNALKRHLRRFFVAIVSGEGRQILESGFRSMAASSLWLWKSKMSGPIWRNSVQRNTCGGHLPWFFREIPDHSPSPRHWLGRCFGGELSDGRAPRQLADRGPLQRRTVARGFQISGRTHPGLSGADSSLARHFCGAQLDRRERARRVRLHPL